MALEQLTLTLNPATDNYEYQIYMIDRVRDNQTKEAFSISPPGAAPSNNLLFGISGMQSDIEIEWAIHDDGTDKANGTYTSTVVTLDEQVTYLKDTIHDPSFSASWTLNHDTGGLYSDREVFIENLSIPVVTRDSPKWLPARLGLRVGEGVG